MGTYFSGRPENKCGNMRVVTPAATTITDAETWYPLAGTFADGLCTMFDVAADGKMTHTGLNGSAYLFVGFSDLSVSTACEVTYGLEVNSVVDSEITTPHTFLSNSKIDNIGIARNVLLNNGDEIYVRVKSDTGSMTLTANTLYLAFKG